MKSPCLFGIVASLLLFTFNVEAQGLDTIASKSNKQINLPEIGVNFGFVNLLSDVALNTTSPSAFTQFGFQLNITQPVAKFLNVSLNLFTGTVYGEEMRGFDNLNYRTSLFSQQLCVEYNFYPLLKPNEEGRQLIRPYVGFGLGAMFFRSKGDLTTTAGETYNYWSDGSIRSIAENDAYAESAIIIQRDFEYESDLRDANLDGLRKYPQTTFTIPINAGIRFQITKHFGVNAAFTYALNFSEMLDNSSFASIGARKSASGNDNHLFGSIGINVFLGSKRPTSNRISEQILASTSPNRWGSNKQVPKSNSESSKPETQVSESVNTRGSRDETSTENTSVLTNKQSAEKEQSSAAKASSAASTKALSSENSNAISDEQSVENEQSGTANTTAKASTEATSTDNSNAIANKQSVKNEQSSTVSTTSVASTEATSIADSNAKNSAQPAKNKNSNAENNESANSTKSNATNTNQNLSLPNSLSENSLAKKDSDKDNTPNKNDANSNSISSNPNSGKSNQVATDGLRNPTELTSQEKAESSRDETSGKSSPALARNDQAKPTSRDVVLTPSEEGKTAQSNSNSKAETADFINQNDSKSTQSNQEITTSKSSEKGQKNTTKSPETDNANSAISKEHQGGKTQASNGEITLKDLQQVSPKATGTFHWADRDQNGTITATEVLFFIDSLFDGNGTLTVEDIQNLIDYYFDQE